MGKLIVLEGTDGSGKSTQFRRLTERLTAEGKTFQKLVFPQYSEPSSALIRMYLGGEFGGSPADVNAYAASAFYAVDRFASYKQDVLDWCDEDASLFYEDENEADTTTHIFDPFEDDILDLDDDYLSVAVESDTGSGKADDDELQGDEHSPEEILELLMTHFQYTKTE